MPQDRFRYTPYYCEENIWYLAREPRFCGQDALVAIISGKAPYRRLWCQRAAENPQAPVFWDYHVILLAYSSGWRVWDLDTTLGLPVGAAEYFEKTFLAADVDANRNDVCLRLIPGEAYVRGFSSDRAHMRSPSGDWSARPPAWPMILRQGRANLLDWLDIDRDSPGRVVPLIEAIQEFSGSGAANRSE